MMVIVNAMCTMFFFLLYYLCDKDSISQVAVVGILQYVWMFSTWYAVTKSWMNVYLIFLGLSFCFYMGQPLLFLLNIDVNSVMTINTSPFNYNQINGTLIFLLKAMALFHFGASFAVRNVEVNTENVEPISVKPIALVGMILFALSFIPALTQAFTALKTTLTIGYSGIFQSEYVTGTGLDGGIPRFLSAFFKASLLLLILGNKDNSKKLKFWILFTIGYVLIMLVSGQRGSNSLFMFGLILLYHHAIKPFTKKQIFNFVWLLLLGGIAFSFISSVRNIGISNYSFTELLHLADKNFLTELLGEMGFTLIACTTVMVYSPSTIPFNDGATYFNSLFSLVPNLFWEVNPAANGGVDQVFKSFLFQNSGMGHPLLSKPIITLDITVCGYSRYSATSSLNCILD